MTADATEALARTEANILLAELLSEALMAGWSEETGWKPSAPWQILAALRGLGYELRPIEQAAEAAVGSAPEGHGPSRDLRVTNGGDRFTPPSAAVAPLEHPKSCSIWFASDGSTGEGICDCGLAAEADYQRFLHPKPAAAPESSTPVLDPPLDSWVLRDLDIIIHQLRSNGYADWPDWLARIRDEIAAAYAAAAEEGT